jgi:medium-chain acyl-[acyl-carrier-protein] hydrolase
MPVLDRPFVFFGHSLGAILSFEVARRLRRGWRIQPTCLFTSGRRAPHIPDLTPPSYCKNDEDFLAYLDELNGTAKEVRTNTELLQLLLPVLRADFELGETYEYLEEAPLACPITAFGGTYDDETSEGKLEGWRLQTTDKFKHYILQGGHFFIHSHENDLLKLLKAELLGLLAL